MNKNKIYRKIYCPNISGVTDFLQWHNLMQAPIYYCQGRVVGCLDLETPVVNFYAFTNVMVYRETNQYIADNWYMFDHEECDRFYYGFHSDRKMYKETYYVPGWILRVKKEYGGWV